MNNHHVAGIDLGGTHMRGGFSMGKRLVTLYPRKL